MDISSSSVSGELSLDNISLLLGCCFCSLAKGSSCTTASPGVQKLGCYGCCLTRGRLAAVSLLCRHLRIANRSENWDIPESLFP